jgi:NADH-quinone oxidoreductase subunit H
LLGVIYLMLKAFFGYFIVMWVRSTLPRIRIDHMLALNWKFLTPLSLALLILTAMVEKIFEGNAWRVPALLIGNALILIVSYYITRTISRRVTKERVTFKKRPVAKPA